MAKPQSKVRRTVHQGKLSFDMPVEVNEQKHVAEVGVTVSMKKSVTISATLKWTTKHIAFTEEDQQSVLSQLGDLLAEAYYGTCDILNQALEDKRQLDFPGQTALFEGQSVTEEEAEVGQPSV